MLRAAFLFLVVGTFCVPQLVFSRVVHVDTTFQKNRPLAVGGDGNWVQSSNATRFQAWASALPPLPVGAVLQFNFMTPYDVVEVMSQLELDTCDLRYARPVKESPEVGARPENANPFMVMLTTPGTQYFTTSMESACRGGVKFSIKVEHKPAAPSHYIVGSGKTDGKWTWNFANEPLLQQWASNIMVQQGDVLEFVFPITEEPEFVSNVVEVPTAAELAACDFSRAVEVKERTISTEGRVVRYFYRVSRTGPHYFANSALPVFCKEGGQKFAINVAPHPIRGWNVHWVGGEENDNMWTSAGTNYQKWADSIEMGWNDLLVFRSTPAEGLYAKVLPSRTAFDTCDFSEAADGNIEITDLMFTTEIQGDTPGPLYLANPKHCHSGMKFFVTVGESPIIDHINVPLIGGISRGEVGYNIGGGSTNLGNLIADAHAYAGSLLVPATVQFGVYNSGGIGPGPSAGPFRASDIFKAFLYPSNTFAVKSLNGSEIRAMFDISAAGYMSGPFLQISSRFHVTQAFNHDGTVSIRKVQYYDDSGVLCDFEDDKYYNVAVNSFMAEGGDDYWMFDGKPNLAESPRLNAMNLMSPDILGMGFVGRDPEVPLNPLENRYTTLGMFLVADMNGPRYVNEMINKYPLYKRDILHAAKEFGYASGDHTFFSSDLTEVTPDDGKGQRFYSAMDDAMNAISHVRTAEGTIVNEALGFMWKAIGMMNEFTENAMNKAMDLGCGTEDDMNVAKKKYLEGLSRVLERPRDVLDEWRESYRIATECVLRGARGDRRLLQTGRKFLRL